MKKYLLLLILCSILVYSNSFGNGFLWDDLNNIIHNTELKGPVNIGEVFSKEPSSLAQFYRPLPFLTIAFDHWLWKDNPSGYHVTNFLFHLFDVMLIFYITMFLANSLPVSFICALLFAVHPIHTEAVAYISGRSDPICAFFLLSSFYLYLRHMNKTALASFILALFSKEVALIFPLALLSYDALFFKGPMRARLKRNAPFFLTAFGFLLFRYLFVRWQPVEMSLSRIYLAPKIALTYLKLLVFPFNFHMQHSLQENGLLLKMPYFLSAILIIGLLIYAIPKIAKNKISLFGFCWFIISLAPFLGIFKLNSDIAEHWLYLPAFGFFLMITALAKDSLLKNKAAISMVIIFLSVLTIQRNYVWRDDVSIYQDTLKYRPDDPKLHYNLGNAYLRRKLFAQAHREYSIALELKPNYPYAANNLRLAKKNLSGIKLVGLAFAGESSFDHSLYEEVLNRHLENGLVDYRALKNDPTSLNAYIKKLSKLDPEALEAMPDKEKIAFYLNTYNALTIKAIIENYPVKSIKDIPGVWDRLKFKVAGADLTLNQIEHEILRKQFKEPRIHFALVCASKGCPELAGEPFSGKALDEQLDIQARNFIDDKARVRLDKDSNTLYLSSIFKWFKEDFGDVIKFVSKYLPAEDSQFIQKEKPSIKYLKYDWSLNEKL